MLLRMTKAIEGLVAVLDATSMRPEQCCSG